MTRNKKRILLFLSGAFVASVANVFLVRHSSSVDLYDCLHRISSSRVVSVEIEREGFVPLVLGKESSISDSRTWYMQKPFRKAADESKILKLLDGVLCTDLKDGLTVGELGKMGRSFSDLGLEKPSLKLRFDDEDGGTNEVCFGNGTPSGSGVYAKFSVGGREMILVVSESVFSSVNLKMDDFLLRSLSSFSPDLVETLDIRRGGEFLRFRKSGENWRMTEPYDSAANRSKIKRFLEMFSNAKISRFVWPSYGMSDLRAEAQLSDSLLSAYGLGAEGAIAVTFRNYDSTSEQILLGSSNAEGEVYAFCANSRSVVSVDSGLKSLALATVSDFADDRAFPYVQDDIRFLSFSRGAETVLISKGDDGEWRIDAPVSAPASQEVVQKILANLLSVRKSTSSKGDLIAGVGQSSEKVSLSYSEIFGSYSFADLRSCDILSLPGNSIKRITVRSGDSQEVQSAEYNLDRNFWENATKASGDKVSERVVNEIVEEFALLRAVRIEHLKVTAEDMRRCGLENPYLSVAVDCRGENASRVNLLIGDKCGDIGRYATLGIFETVFVLSESTVEKLSSKLLVPQQ